ncbi:MAG TPA: PAS domain S-box protein [Methanospirillum sp.]|nr:PAS domain S-box protein [Methanospirillum sp.]
MHSDDPQDWNTQRNKIIGLGESSLRKSYYPELQQQLQELTRKNEEIQATYEQLAATEEELRANYEELTATEEELQANIDELHQKDRELRESEERYRTVFENTGTAIAILESDTTISLANTQFVCLCGYQKEDLEGKRSWTEFVVPQDLAEMQQQHHLRRKNREKALTQYEFRFVTRSGEIRHIFLNIDMIPGTTQSVASLMDITDRKRAEEALVRANTKLNLLNSITIKDIQNAVFCLSGYVDLETAVTTEEEVKHYLDEQKKIIRTISQSLMFANYYQNLGLKPSLWQDVQQTFLFGISHLDISALSRTLEVEGLEIFADPLLENVFFSLAENVATHAEGATGVSLAYYEDSDGLTLVFEDNGPGIPDSMKEVVFEKDYRRQNEMGLFLVREILEVTNISIHERGRPGEGARFLIHVPKGMYRFREEGIGMDE